MKKIVLVAALAALSACSQKAEDAAPAAETAAADAAPAATSGAAGTYDVKMPDGSMAKTVINADGTYVDTDPKGAEVKGKFAQKDGKDCFDADGDEPEVCWTVTKPDASGAFTATAPDGKTTVTVSPAKP